jgi:hypothetical protein
MHTGIAQRASPLPANYAFISQGRSIRMIRVKLKLGMSKMRHEITRRSEGCGPPNERKPAHSQEFKRNRLATKLARCVTTGPRLIGNPSSRPAEFVQARVDTGLYG